MQWNCVSFVCKNRSQLFHSKGETRWSKMHSGRTSVRYSRQWLETDTWLKIAPKIPTQLQSKSDCPKSCVCPATAFSKEDGKTGTHLHSAFFDRRSGILRSPSLQKKCPPGLNRWIRRHTRKSLSHHSIINSKTGVVKCHWDATGITLYGQMK